MDLADIQGRLNALGVSLVFGDDRDVPAPQRAQLITQRQYRAALYIDKLRATSAFMTDARVPGSPAGPVAANTNGLGADYGFARAALASGELLNDLAESLDQWICVAVRLAIDAAPVNNAPTRYEGWFNTNVFDASDARYTANVRAFFQAYPITDHALTEITDNFQNNVATAARRIVNDRTRIATLFADLYYRGLTLNALTSMQSTGSDFHKGGTQVLILSFRVAAFYGYGLSSELRLIYKPADMEIDCLITGNSAAVNAVYPRANPGAPAFLDNSLVELFNAEAAANGPAGTVPLRTYRILPCRPTSTAAGPGVPLRDAYGYAEYLNNEKAESWGAYNYYPFGASDFVIFRGTDPAPVIERFYHQLGQLLAIASIFSLSDLHVENLRVRGYEPYLIDLEASLTEPILNIGRTYLFHNGAGGIDGWLTYNYIWFFNNAPGRVSLDQLRMDKFHANRLERYSATGKRVVAVDPVLLAEGLSRGLAVLASLQNQGGWAGWFNRVRRVLVRLIPVGTGDWLQVRRNVYENFNRLAPIPALANAIEEEVLGVVTRRHAIYPGPPAPPEYLAPASAQATNDVDNFDIPVFYTRVGTLDMLDSTGSQMVMPATVRLSPPGSAAVPTGFGPGGARTTYYAVAPATAQNQLAALPGGLPGTTRTFTDQMLRLLGHRAMPARPAVVL